MASSSLKITLSKTMDLSKMKANLAHYYMTQKKYPLINLKMKTQGIWMRLQAFLLWPNPFKIMVEKPLWRSRHRMWAVGAPWFVLKTLWKRRTLGSWSNIQCPWWKNHNSRSLFLQRESAFSCHKQVLWRSGLKSTSIANTSIRIGLGVLKTTRKFLILGNKWRRK